MAVENGSFDLEITFCHPGEESSAAAPADLPTIEVIQAGPVLGELRDRPLDEPLDVAAFAINLVRERDGAIPGMRKKSTIPANPELQAKLIGECQFLPPEREDVESNEDYVASVRGAVDSYFAPTNGWGVVKSLMKHRQARRHNIPHLLPPNTPSPPHRPQAA